MVANSLHHGNGQEEVIFSNEIQRDKNKASEPSAAQLYHLDDNIHDLMSDLVIPDVYE